jgi:hypothetical protein
MRLDRSLREVFPEPGFHERRDPLEVAKILCYDLPNDQAMHLMIRMAQPVSQIGDPAPRKVKWPKVTPAVSLLTRAMRPECVQAGPQWSQSSENRKLIGLYSFAKLWRDGAAQHDLRWDPKGLFNNQGDALMRFRISSRVMVAS